MKGKPLIDILEPDSKPTLAVRLRAILDARGWTAYRLAKEAGFRAEVVSRLLNGERSPAWDTACRIADALGVKLDDLR